MAQGFTHITPIFSAGGVQSNTKFAFSAGTYVGSGGATTAIVSTGLKKVHMVFGQVNHHGRSVATDAARYTVRMEKAAGTPGSFYPHMFRTGATNNEILNRGDGSAASINWLAIGSMNE